MCEEGPQGRVGHLHRVGFLWLSQTQDRDCQQTGTAAVVQPRRSPERETNSHRSALTTTMMLTCVRLCVMCTHVVPLAVIYGRRWRDRSGTSAQVGWHHQFSSRQSDDNEIHVFGISEGQNSPIASTASDRQPDGDAKEGIAGRHVRNCYVTELTRTSDATGSLPLPNCVWVNDEGHVTMFGQSKLSWWQQESRLGLRRALQNRKIKTLGRCSTLLE